MQVQLTGCTLNTTEHNLAGSNMVATTLVAGRMYLVRGFGVEDFVMESTPFAAIKRFLSQVNQ